MKTIVLLSAALICLAASPLRAGEELAVIVSGQAQEAIETYKSGSNLYIDAKRVGALYGGQIYWYPISGRIQLSLRGRSMQLVAGSDKATSGEEELRLGNPVIVRVSHAFLPLSFLTGPDFARWSGHETRFDERTRTLIVERQGTIGAPRVFSYKGRTRVSLEVTSGAVYRASPRGTGGVDLIVEYGVAEGEEKASIDDGIVSSYALKQEARLTRLSVRFAENGQRWRVFELDEPRRAVIEVYAPGVEPPMEAAPSPAAAPVPTSATVSAVPPDVAKKTPVAVPVPVQEPLKIVKKTAKSRRLIIIDPGHGGKDPGASGRRGTREKDVNLAMAFELARVLRERGDFEVLLTRKDDTFVPLSERSELANSKEADLFVSLHCNAASNKNEHGFEVYSVSETATDPAAESLAAAENSVLELEGKNPQDETAKMILLAMTKTEMINESAAFAALAAKKIGARVDVAARGAKQAGFYVLRGTHAPAILVEMAFLTNAADEARLTSRRFRRTMAEGISASVADYARRQGWLE